MNKKSIINFLILGSSAFLVSNAIAQDKKNPVLMTISGENITKSEFEKVYKKNNIKDATFDKKTLEDYLELYVNYKLKVKEAEELQLDTSTSFKNELAGYRKQLAQPYLVDKDVSEKLIREAYDRLMKDVRASHILIKISSDALPKDTLIAYNKALKIRERIIKNVDFAAIAKETSDDPSAKENGGDLGYFTALQMVYPFESAAFKTKVGSVSMPVRTRFGYHLIKVSDIREAQGEIHVAHIMIKTPPGMSAEDSIKAKNKIDEISKELKSGKRFEDLAQQFSDDPGSAKNGGVLPFFGTGRMVPEFEKVAFSLKNNNDISEPIKTAYGWHIIKRLEKKPVGKFEDLQSDLKAKISKDSRSELSRTSFINRVKKEYNFKEDKKALEEFNNVIDSSLVKGKWTIDKAQKLNKTLFSLLDKKYSQQDFAKYVADHQASRRNATAQSMVNVLYEQFTSESCISFEESRLDIKYPEFKALMQEYRDGILLFELTDRKVWSKAIKDSVGLKAFYDGHKNNYMWNERLDAAVYNCANADIAKQVRALVKKKKSNEKILEEINKTSALNLTIKEGKFSVTDNEIIDGIKWEKGITDNMDKGKTVVFVVVKNKLAPQPKTLEEAKGLVTADYQAQLEKVWIDSLKKKFPVVVHDDVLSTVGQ